MASRQHPYPPPTVYHQGPSPARYDDPPPPPPTARHHARRDDVYQLHDREDYPGQRPFHPQMNSWDHPPEEFSREHRYHDPSPRDLSPTPLPAPPMERYHSQPGSGPGNQYHLNDYQHDSPMGRPRQPVGAEMPRDSSYEDSQWDGHDGGSYQQGRDYQQSRDQRPHSFIAGVPIQIINRGRQGQDEFSFKSDNSRIIPVPNSEQGPDLYPQNQAFQPQGGPAYYPLPREPMPYEAHRVEERRPRQRSSSPSGSSDAGTEASTDTSISADMSKDALDAKRQLDLGRMAYLMDELKGRDVSDIGSEVRVGHDKDGRASHLTVIRPQAHASVNEANVSVHRTAAVQVLAQNGDQPLTISDAISLTQSRVRSIREYCFSRQSNKKDDTIQNSLAGAMSGLEVKGNHAEAAQRGKGDSYAGTDTDKDTADTRVSVDEGSTVADSGVSEDAASTVADSRISRDGGTTDQSVGVDTRAASSTASQLKRSPSWHSNMQGWVDFERE